MSFVAISAERQCAVTGLTAQEEQALLMAAELRDRVRRERAVVRRIRAYLDRTQDVTAEP